MAVQETNASDTSPAMLIARIERLPRTFWHAKARMIVGMATLFDGFDGITIAYVLPALIPLWKLSYGQIGFMITVGYIGQFVGAIFFGWLADTWGRTRALALATVVLGVMSLACALAWNYESFLWFRTIQGIGLGGEVPVAASYIAEMAKARGRGRFFLLYELVFAAGLLMAAFVAMWLIPNFGWQSMFVVGALPALLVFPILRMLPESARWLISKNKTSEAAEIVDWFETDTKNRGYKIPPIDPATVQTPAASEWRWTDLFSGIYLKRTLVLWTLWFCTYVVVYSFILWLPTIYTNVYKLDHATAIRYAFIAQLVSLGSSVITAFIFDRFSRGTWFVLAFAGSAVPLIALWWEGATSAQIVLWCTTISYVFIGANTAALFIYSGEIYPTRFRSFGISVATMWVRVGAALTPPLVGYMVPTYGLGITFLVFAAIAIFGAIMATGAPDARDRVLEEISP